MAMVALGGYGAADMQAVGVLRVADAINRLAAAVEQAGSEQSNAINNVSDVMEGVARLIFGHDEFASAMDRMRLERGDFSARDLQRKLEWRHERLVQAKYRPNRKQQIAQLLAKEEA